MQNPKILAALAAVLLLVGAGCAKTEVTSNTNETLVIPDSSSNNESESGSESEAEAETKPEANAVSAADGWQTYTNAALGFSFNWPSKGRYAPTWEVKFAKEGDASVKDGCFVATGATNSKSGEFCHASVAPAAGEAKDYFTTTINGQHVTLAFTKKESGKDFSWSDYQEELEQIVSSFKK